jgi:hypothetical protein
MADATFDHVIVQTLVATDTVTVAPTFGQNVASATLAAADLATLQLSNKGFTNQVSLMAAADALDTPDSRAVFKVTRQAPPGGVSTAFEAHFGDNGLTLRFVKNSVVVKETTWPWMVDSAAKVTPPSSLSTPPPSWFRDAPALEVNQNTMRTAMKVDDALAGKNPVASADYDVVIAEGAIEPDPTPGSFEFI